MLKRDLYFGDIEDWSSQYSYRMCKFAMVKFKRKILRNAQKQWMVTNIEKFAKLVPRFWTLPVRQIVYKWRQFNIVSFLKSDQPTKITPGERCVIFWQVSKNPRVISVIQFQSVLTQPLLCGPELVCSMPATGPYK